jgi:Uma2 family endonuclease
MALWREEFQEKMKLDEFFTFAESDPDHRYELIDGVPYMMTGGSPDHAIMSANLIRLLGEKLRKRPCIAYSSDVYVDVGDNDENCNCPDASVSCDPRDRHATKFIRYPSVIAEVLSPSTKAKDLGIKAEQYQNMPSVQEILFVHSQVIRIVLYRREPEFWTIRSYTQDDTIELASLGISFAVAEVYEKTTFDDTFMSEA